MRSISSERLADRFYDYLCQRFPEHTFGGAYVSVTEKEYDFEARKPYETLEMYRAIIDFVLDNFGFLEEDLEMRLYWAG
jgi:hypothetical protein